MTRRPSITAAIIALNEEAKLPGLLRRLDWVDEIVVVDGGSDDATFDIAQRHGCHVVSRKLDSFARQRNFAVQVAGGDWVFSIDADERPTPRLIDEVRSRVARCTQQAFRVPIRSTILRRPLRWSGTQDDCPVRLFRRQSARWVGDVHEVLDVAGRVGCLEHWLEHETLPDLPAFLAKIEHYTTLEARARVAAGRRPACYAPWLAPPREVFRRLIWKQGLLDGPAGWAFSLLSGWSEWVLANKHRRLWQEAFPAPSQEKAPARIIHVGWVEVAQILGGARRLQQSTITPCHLNNAGHAAEAPPTTAVCSTHPTSSRIIRASRGCKSAVAWPKHPWQRFG
jgi:hypothetical protein